MENLLSLWMIPTIWNIDPIILNKSLPPLSLRRVKRCISYRHEVNLYDALRISNAFASAIASSSPISVLHWMTLAPHSVIQ